MHRARFPVTSTEYNLPAMTNLAAVVTQLEQERNRLSSELNGVEQAIQALS
jgi:hypothetical protein